MKFEIDFNDLNKYDDNFLIDVLGAELESIGSTKYPPFERLVIEIEDFKHLEQILKLVDEKFETISTALVSFDPSTIFIEL